MDDHTTTFLNGIMGLNKIFVFVNNKTGCQSGGNIYNVQIGHSLQRLGYTVFHTSDIYAKDLFKDNYIFILDSIIIDEYFDLDTYRNQKAYFLVHLWPSFNKDIDEKKRVLLLEKQKEICQSFPIIFAGEHSMNQCSSFYKGKLLNHFIIPPAVHSNWRKKNEYSPTANHFLIIGNLCKRKRQLEVVELFSSLSNSLNLSIVGRIDDKNYGNKILQKINSCSNRIVLHEEVEYHRMNDFMLNYDAVILFSEEENNSMALLESIASGIPIITTPTGNYEAYREHKVGYVLNGFEVSELSTVIIQMHTDALFYKQQCNSVANFKVNSWDKSASLFLQL